MVVEKTVFFFWDAKRYGRIERGGEEGGATKDTMRQRESGTRATLAATLELPGAGREAGDTRYRRAVRHRWWPTRATNQQGEPENPLFLFLWRAK